MNLRAPNLVNFEDTDVTSPTFGTTFFPTADTPPLSDQSRRVATTDFVYKVATNDTGGRVYVSQTIGSDLNDGQLQDLLKQLRKQHKLLTDYRKQFQIQVMNT